MTTELSTMKLSELESIVDRGLETFVEVGSALLEIRDGKMYGSEYETFDDYCQGRFGFTKRRANQLIEATETVRILGTIVPEELLPTTESQVRELQNATSDPKQQAKILKKAAKSAPKDTNGKPRITASQIKVAAGKSPTVAKAAGIASDPEANRIANIRQSTKTGGTQFDPDKLEAELQAEKIDPSAPVIDENGQPVPKNLQDIFRQVPAWKSAMRLVSDLKSAVTKLCEHKASGYLDVQEIERLIAQTRTQIKFAMPYTECPKCRRKPVKSCDNCKGTGWITKAILTACACDDDTAWLGARK